MINIIWKDIINYEGLYEVNNLGEVRNIKTNKLIVGDINNCGYYRVGLSNQGKTKKFFRHRLVAIHFLQKKDNSQTFVNHINGDKSDNTVGNLEWVTQSENEKHAFRLGLKSKCNKPILLEIVGRDKVIFDNQYILANFLGVAQTTVSNWLNNKNKPSSTYNIRYIGFVDINAERLSKTKV